MESVVFVKPHLKVNLSPNEQAANLVVVICKACNFEKNRINAGRYPNGKDTKYVDETNREWNGLMCPPCHLARLKVKQKFDRATDSRRKKKANARRRSYYKRTGK